MVVDVNIVTISWDVGNLTWSGPYVQHVYALVVRGTHVGILDEVVVVDEHILARLPSEVCDDAEALPCEVGAETANPWCIAVLAQEHRVVGLVVCLGDVAVLVVPHRLTGA